MAEKEALIQQVRVAFARVEYPGDWCLRGSNEGDEPYLIERDFKGKTDWRTLDPEFIDQSPEGLASSLSFFSDEAFHFYLPAYLIADIDGRLKQSDPVFHLTHGLRDSSKRERINQRRYGERAWFDAARCKFAMFNPAEAAAIVAYLKFKAEVDCFVQDAVNEAIRNYWSSRIGEAGAAPNGPTSIRQRSGVNPYLCNGQRAQLRMNTARQSRNQIEQMTATSWERTDRGRGRVGGRGRAALGAK